MNFHHFLFTLIILVLTNPFTVLIHSVTFSLCLFVQIKSDKFKADEAERAFVTFYYYFYYYFFIENYRISLAIM